MKKLLLLLFLIPHLVMGDGDAYDSVSEGEKRIIKDWVEKMEEQNELDIKNFENEHEVVFLGSNVQEFNFRNFYYHPKIISKGSKRRIWVFEEKEFELISKKKTSFFNKAYIEFDCIDTMKFLEVRYYGKSKNDLIQKISVPSSFREIYLSPGMLMYSLQQKICR